MHACAETMYEEVKRFSVRYKSLCAELRQNADKLSESLAAVAETQGCAVLLQLTISYIPKLMLHSRS